MLKHLILILNCLNIDDRGSFFMFLFVFNSWVRSLETAWWQPQVLQCSHKLVWLIFQGPKRLTKKKKRKKWCKWEREKRGKKYATYHFLLWMSPLNSVFFYQTRWETFRHTLNVNRAASLWFTDHKDNLLGQSSCPRHGVPADGLNIVLFSFIKLSGEPYGIR